MCHYRREQLSKVQKQALRRIVSKCGYNRNTKKEVLFGPLMYGGANFWHLFHQQGLGQVTLFFRHWQQQSTAGHLLKNVVAWAQFTAARKGESNTWDTSGTHPTPGIEVVSITTWISGVNQCIPTRQSDRTSYSWARTRWLHNGMYPTLATVHTRQRSDRSKLLTPLFKCGSSIGSDNHKRNVFG
jgi:hypothetical protein